MRFVVQNIYAHASGFFARGEAAWRFVRGSSRSLDALIEAEMAHAERQPWSAGPVSRLERLAPPPDAEDIARRRFGWLAERLEVAQQVWVDLMSLVFSAGVGLAKDRLHPHAQHQRTHMASPNNKASSAQKLTQHAAARGRVVQMRLLGL